MTQTTTTRDPILDEIRHTRDQIAQKFGGDVKAILDDAAKRQDTSSQPLETLAEAAIATAERVSTAWANHAPALGFDGRIAARLASRCRADWAALDHANLSSVVADCESTLERIHELKPSMLEIHSLAFLCAGNSIFAIKHAAEALQEGIKLREMFGQREPQPVLKHWLVVYLEGANARADLAFSEST